MNEWRAQINPTLELLCREFPKCFVLFERRRRPLKVGIITDIMARLGGQIDRERLGPALRFYVGNLHYRMAQWPGAPRIDLDGNECGFVSETDAASAAAEVQRIRTAVAIKKQTPVCPSEPVLTPEIIVLDPALPSKRLAGLGDLREAAKRRRAAAMA